MSKQSFDGPGGRGAADDGATAGGSLQPEYAFVVQLRGGPATSGDCLQGRVEHVVSGDAVRFGSTAELVEFLTRGRTAGPRPRRGAP